MSSRKAWLKKSRLYLVLDAGVNSYEEILRIGEKSSRCGVDIIQIRDKNGSARQIAELAVRLKKRMDPRVPLIINDRADVALACQADGVHLGQDDLDVKLARKILGSKAIVGRSCQTLTHAKKAEAEGADYIGFGSVFKTKTKPERRPMDLKLLEKVCVQIRVPVFAIGGIDASNVGMLRDRQVERIAVTRAISQAGDIARAVELLKYQRKAG